MGGAESRIWAVPETPSHQAKSIAFIDAFAASQQISASLTHLKGWSRQDLVEAIYELRRSPRFTVSVMAFTKALSWPSRHQAENAFAQLRPKDGRLDMLQLIGPMAIMADEHFVTRASLLFSIFDFNSSGAVGRAEVIIALRSIMSGFARLSRHFVMPTPAEIEGIASHLFSEIDTEQVGIILLGEFLSYTYRSREFRTFCSPFPSAKVSVMEEQVYFSGRRWSDTSRGMAGASSQPTSPTKGERLTTRFLETFKLRSRLTLAPETVDSTESEDVLRRIKPQGRSRRRPWAVPLAITRSHAWLLHRVFHSLSIDGRTVSTKDLLALLGDHGRLKEVVHSAVSSAPPDVAQPPDALRVARHFYGHLAAESPVECAQSLLAAHVSHLSIRAFCHVVWPQLPEVEIERCMNWCRHAKSLAALQLMDRAAHEGSHIIFFDLEDLWEIVEIMDGHDVKPSIEELCEQGVLDKGLLTKVSQRFEGDSRVLVSKPQYHAFFRQLHEAMILQHRACFGSTTSPRCASPRSASPSADGQRASPRCASPMAN